jgi:peptide/nickel transport system permease protein
MLAYTARRLLIVLVTLLVASAIVFFVLEIVPGDPARLMLGLNATEDAVAALREQMGLNQPVLTRYLSWLAGMARGDFGESLTYSVPVTELIADRVVVSLPLALLRAGAVDADRPSRRASCRARRGGPATPR